MCILVPTPRVAVHSYYRCVKFHEQNKNPWANKNRNQWTLLSCEIRSHHGRWWSTWWSLLSQAHGAAEAPAWFLFSPLQVSSQSNISTWCLAYYISLQISGECRGKIHPSINKPPCSFNKPILRHRTSSALQVKYIRKGMALCIIVYYFHKGHIFNTTVPLRK